MPITIPLKTVSESNAREHWAAKARRVKQHRQTAELAMRSLGRGIEPPVHVTLVRVAPRLLDDDNIRGCLKACRDGIADALGVDDRDPRVSWGYAQRRGRPKEYAVVIEFTPMDQT